jgi:hypothetical protein
MIPLDQIYLLQLANEGYNLEDFKEKKITVLIRAMKLKGWLNDEGLITKAGQDVWNSMFLPEEELELNKLSKHLDDFEVWWNTFPANNGFEYKGKRFPVTRSMRIKKEDCRIKFHKIISEGNYTAIQLIQAIKVEVQARKDESIAKKSNQLSFMRSTLPYLNGSLYEGFIDVGMREDNVKQTQKFL